MNALKLAQPPLGHTPIRSMSSPSVLSESRHRRNSSEQQLNPTRMQSLVPMLRALRSSQTLSEHVALVKHLQFSPDGQFLATCSWDKTALIWKVGSGPNDEFGVLHKLVHTSRIGGFVGQVAWSPTTGDQLLTKQLKTIKVWDPKVSAIIISSLSEFGRSSKGSRLVYAREQSTANETCNPSRGYRKAPDSCLRSGEWRQGRRKRRSGYITLRTSSGLIWLYWCVWPSFIFK